MGEGSHLTAELRRAVEGFRRETGIQRIIIFGSTVRSDADPADLDLLLVDPRFAGRKFFERPVGLRAQWTVDVPVDLLCYTPEEFEALKGRPGLVQTAVAEGVTVTG